jgi:hypothetical protein
MKRRSPWHDYHRQGTYMLTLAVEGRRPLLGRVMPCADAQGTVAGADAQGTVAGADAQGTVAAADAQGTVAAADAQGTVAPTPATTPAAATVPTPATTPAAATVPAASAAGKIAAHVELTPLGRAILDEEARKVSAVFPMVEVWKLCIMPDHIHMIVRVKEDMPEGKHLGQVVAGFKGGCSRAWWRLQPSADAQGAVAAADAQGAMAKKPPLFEPGYNDQILLDDGQLDNWKHYLDDNPRRLAIKRLHPDLFVTTHYVDIGEWHCQSVGNRFLLDIPQKVAVIVHGAYTDKDYARYRELWLACGEAGGVLVSAAIATREKEVMHEAMERGYRVIWVRENGFPPL